MPPFIIGRAELYEALSASTDDYIFVGNMKTGVFCYPQAMVEEFGLPGQVVREAAAFWGQLIHPHDEAYFLESNQSIADGREEYHNIEYRARNVRGSGHGCGAGERCSGIRTGSLSCLPA